MNKELSPNEKLPSKRTLSTYLGISLNTVIEAYNLLLDEELIISIPKKGYYVSEYDISITKDISIDSLEIEESEIHNLPTLMSLFATMNMGRVPKRIIELLNGDLADLCKELTSNEFLQLKQKDIAALFEMSPSTLSKLISKNNKNGR